MLVVLFSDHVLSSYNVFVDRIIIDVEAGSGGNGCMSFRRERYVPKGGPNGGDGGHGGNVIIVAENGVDSLSPLAHHKQWKADRGGHGTGSNRHGRSGKDLTIKVPPGTIVKDFRNKFVLKDLAQLGDRVTAARGGKGGYGNTHFKSSTNRAPRKFTLGEQGEARRLELELKVIADVGLIGLPNAGKSTLLSRLSGARPQTADYPFTTKHPNLGQVRLARERFCVMADIPGLIEGAHRGQGLGHEFLRHVERTEIFVHLVEPTPMNASDPVHNFHTIREELVQFNPILGNRREIVIVSKAELPGSMEIQQRLKEILGRDVLLISAVTGAGLDKLKTAIAQALDSAKNLS